MTTREEAEAREREKKRKYDWDQGFQRERRATRRSLRPTIGSDIEELQRADARDVGTIEGTKASITAKMGILHTDIAERLARDLSWIGRNVTFAVEDATEAIGDLKRGTEELRVALEEASKTSTAIGRKANWITTGIAVIALVAALAAWLRTPVKVYGPPSSPPPAASPASPSAP